MIEESRRCPYCDELIRYNAVKCKHCGSVLTNSQSVSTGIITPGTQVRMALSFKYEIMEEIGRGGMASVYKAMQKNLNRLVALKVIHQNLVYDSEFLQRFHQEAQLAASLNHPNIVTIYDEGAVNNIHYMAMEYLTGNDLHRIIKYNKKINIEDSIKIIISIANALDHAHVKGLIHRDIKSANIIITNEGKAVLTDFGIAFAANRSKLTQTGSLIGTPEYMSPEQAKGIITDNRSDIYSLGVVMFESLTGKVPFTSDNPLTTIFKILNENPPLVKELNKEVPHWLSTIVNKTLEKDPQKRFQTGKEFASALINRKPVTAEILNRRKNKKQNIIGVSKYSANHIKKANNKIYFWLIVPLLGIAFAVLSIAIPSDSKAPVKENQTNLAQNNLSNQNNLHSSINYADSLYLSGNYKDSFDIYSEILLNEPGNEHAKSGIKKIQMSFVDRANNALANSEFQNAKDIVIQGMEIFPEDVELQKIISAAEEEINKKLRPPQKFVEVPDVVDKQLEVARSILKSFNLRVGKTTQGYVLNKKGLVINQIPGSGTRVNEGSPITLVIGE